MREDAAALFSAGFDSVRLYHVDEPNIPRMVALGLKGLADIDPEFTIERDAGTLTALYRGISAAQLVEPAPGDVVRWSYLAAAVIETARLRSKDIAKADPERIYETVFNAAFVDLDRFSRYLSAKDARVSRAHRQGYTGIGISLGKTEVGIVIRRVFEDTPAEEMGLQAGDVIRAVNGTVILDWTLDRVVALLRGPDGSQVDLTIDRQGKPVLVTVDRRKVIEQTVFSTLTDRTSIIQVSSFNERTSERMREQIAAARDRLGPALNGVVLDLRGNRGGMLDEAINLADLFIHDGTILMTFGRHRDARQDFAAEPDDDGEVLPLIVLIDSASASASEVVAAALQDSGRGLLIGARSYGKGSVQRVRDLPNNGALNLTWAKMHAPSGYALSRFGVFPTICTGGEQRTPEAMLARIRRGEVLDANLGLLRRVADTLDPAAQNSLLQRCGDRPRSIGQPDYDLELALGLLAEPALYKQIFSYSLLAMQRAPASN